MRGECKTAGGKLVAVSVETDGRTGVTSCRLDGDFFVDAPNDAAGDALLRDIEHALSSGEPVGPVLDRHPQVRLVGTTATAIETAYARALSSDPSPLTPSVFPLAPAGGGCRPNGRLGVVQQPARSTSPLPPSPSSISITHNPRYRDRWLRLGHELRVVMDTPRPAAEQMALDETWARQVADGSRPATLRFWNWAEPAIVVGRFQSIPDEVNEEAARAAGFTVVRRCTGGGAMFVRPEDTITYSLYAPLWFVRGMGVEESYRLCDAWLIAALRRLGVDAGFSGLNDIACPEGKIGGAAQRRFPVASAQRRFPAASAPGAVLHHVTLAYGIDADTMVRVLNVSDEKIRDKAVRSARKRVAPLSGRIGLNRDGLVRYLSGAALEWWTGLEAERKAIG